ncbi:MAG: hypothetical protein AAFP70_01905 [Calditrichota bacterium]
MLHNIFRCLCICLFCSSGLFAQLSDSPIRIFGYFQNQFEAQRTIDAKPAQKNTSFSLQQLNLFFQKDLHDAWTAFINIEMLNSFSDSRRTGAINLEEAWVKFRSSKHFNLKLGLQIPIFNNLNEIKNRTPLLPYVIRPLVYETSFNEFIDIDAFVPGQAYIQAYGFKPMKTAKLDYAVYLGNSDNLNDNSIKSSGRSGTDSTEAFLIGGRLGLRKGELKIGSSFTYDRVNSFMGLENIFGGNPDRFELLPRVRFGGDLSFNWKSFSFEGEYIHLIHDDDIDEFSLDKDFFYATAGCWFMDERLYTFVSYWQTNEDAPIEFLTQNRNQIVPGQFTPGELEINVPNIGFSYNLTDLIRIKSHYAYVTINTFEDGGLLEKEKFHDVSAAISIIF